VIVLIVRAAVVQFRAERLTEASLFYRQMRAVVRQAAQAGAQLIALPAYTGLLALPESGEPTGENLRRAASSRRAIYLATFSRLAAEFRMHIAAGTLLLPDQQGRLYHTAHLFGPGGELVGTARQTHLGLRERAWGLACGDELPVFPTPVGRLGFVLGEDVRYPEVSRILALQGANVLVHPAATTAESQAAWLARLWREVQGNQVFGLEAALVGDLWGTAGRGRSTIHAPLEMTAGNNGYTDYNGILAQAQTSDSEEIVLADLDFARLQQVVDEYHIFGQLNYRLYEREFPAAYRRQKTTETQRAQRE
jgi:predicted amidohydrolase